MSEKAVLRTKLLAARRVMPPGALGAAASHVSAVVADLARHHPRVAAYVPVGTEPGGALPDTLAATGCQVLLPVLLPDLDLDWALYTGELTPGPHGLLQPSGPSLGPVAIAAVDLVIVPALAVDTRGNRLGRGGGSYDRALARVPAGVPIVALLHDGELLEHVPREPHDRPVTAVVTPSGGWCDLARAGRSGFDAAHLALGMRECQDGGI